MDNTEEYVVDLSEVTSRMDEQEEVLSEIVEDIRVMNENIVNTNGVLIGLIGILFGFICAKELLKVWLS